MRASVRWIVPAAVAGLIGGGVAVSSAVADGPPSVPARSAQDVLASVAASKITALSGTVQTRTELGLPDLSAVQGLRGSSGDSGSAGNRATDLQGLLTRFMTGENTLRVWADGPDRQKVQLLDPFDELDVVRDGTTLWTYSSKQNVAGKGTLTAHDDAHGTAAAAGGGTAKALDQQMPTPQAAAQRAIAALDPTTSVTLGTPATVAGRATYSLVLTPRTTATLVERIVINVDAENGAPLRTGIYARGQADAAVLTGFTSVDFATPAASLFRFTPPSSAKVEALPSWADGAKAASPGATAPDANRPTVTGTGWAAIVETKPGDLSGPLSQAGAGGLGGAAGAVPGGPTGSGASVFEQLTTPVAGGRAVRTSLFSVLFTDDGRTYAGAVPVQALVDAAKG